MRETREMSIRQCPHYLTPGLIVDSLSFDPVTLQRHTYYTFIDSLVDTSLVTPGNMLSAHRLLAEEVRDDMGMRTLKKHGVSFHYHYRLQSDGRTLYTDSVTADEY